MSRLALRGSVVLVAGALLLLATVNDLSSEALVLSKAAAAFGGAAAVAIWLLRRFGGVARADAVSLRAGVVLLSLTVSLISCELGLRVAYRDITSTADHSSWFAQRWRREHVQTNSLGFREREFVAEKSPGVYRIAVVGDSLAYGQGIAAEERFAARIEEELRSRRAPVEVLTFAQPGADTEEHLEFLEQAADTASPDAVLLQWYVNDPGGGGTVARGAVRRLWPHWTHVLLIRHSVLYFFLNSRFAAYQWDKLGVREEDVAYSRKLGDPTTPECAAYRAELEGWIDRAIELGIEPSIVLFPDQQIRLPEPYIYDGLHEMVCGTFRDRGAPCVDLRATYRSYEGPHSDVIVNRLDTHPSALTNRLAAEAILEELGPRWVAAASNIPTGPQESP